MASIRGGNSVCHGYGGTSKVVFSPLSCAPSCGCCFVASVVGGRGLVSASVHTFSLHQNDFSVLWFMLTCNFHVWGNNFVLQSVVSLCTKK